MSNFVTNANSDEDETDDTSKSVKQTIEEIPKLLQTFNARKDENEREENSVTLSNLDLGNAIINDLKDVEVKLVMNLPEHMVRFFMPAERIIPKQYKRKVKNDTAADTINYDIEDGARITEVKCYTHTITLGGHCWVLCDRMMLRPCISHRNTARQIF